MYRPAASKPGPTTRISDLFRFNCPEIVVIQAVSQEVTDKNTLQTSDVLRSEMKCNVWKIERRSCSCYRSWVASPLKWDILHETNMLSLNTTAAHKLRRTGIIVQTHCGKMWLSERCFLPAQWRPLQLDCWSSCHKVTLFTGGDVMTSSPGLRLTPRSTANRLTETNERICIYWLRQSARIMSATDAAYIGL